MRVFRITMAPKIMIMISSAFSRPKTEYPKILKGSILQRNRVTSTVTPHPHVRALLDPLLNPAIRTITRMIGRKAKKACIGETPE